MKLLVLGAGEYSQIVKELAQNVYSTIDFLDDNSDMALAKLEFYKELIDKYQNAIVAIGNNEVRIKWIELLESVGYNIPTIISHQAFVSPSATIEPGCIVEPMAVINANAVIEKGSIISSGAIVNHNAIIHRCCHIDCNSVVGADAVVPEKMHLMYGQVITRVTKPNDWEFSE